MEKLDIVQNQNGIQINRLSTWNKTVAINLDHKFKFQIFFIFKVALFFLCIFCVSSINLNF